MVTETAKLGRALPALDALANLFMGEVFAALDLIQPNLDLLLEPLFLVEAFGQHLAGELGRRLTLAGGERFQFGLLLWCKANLGSGSV